MKLRIVMLVAVMATMVLPSLVLGQETNSPLPPWVHGLSDQDIACVLSSQPSGWLAVNTPQSGGADGSPSATLAVLFVPPDGGTNSIEFDRLNGRSISFRGGEAGQIQPTSQEVFGVVLMDNAEEFANFYSQPSAGIVEEGGDPLELVGLEFLHGRGNVRVEFFRDGESVAVIDGALGPSSQRSISFLTLSEMTGMDSSWTPGQLAALGIPVNQTGCWTFRLRAEVPENAVLGIGVGTFQSRLSYLSVGLPPTNTPTGTVVPQGTQIPAFVPSCPEGQIPVFDGAERFLQCLAFAG